MLLRPLTAGLGLVTGGVAKKMGKTDIIDYDNKKSLEESFRKSAQANADINRSIMGISMMAAQAGALMAYGAFNKKDKKEGDLGSAFDAVKKNPIMNKALNKFGADALMLMYSSYEAKVDGEKVGTYANAAGFIKYVEGLTNIGQGFSNPERLERMASLSGKNTDKAHKEMMGILGEEAKALIPTGLDVPFYRAYKGAVYLGKSAIQGKAELPPFYKPQTLFQGVMDNGVYNDLDQLFGWHTMFPKAERPAPDNAFR